MDCTIWSVICFRNSAFVGIEFAFLEKVVVLPEFPKRGSLDAFAKSQRQAQIQLKGRHSGKPEYEFNDVEEDRGFLKLPPPSEAHWRRPGGSVSREPTFVGYVIFIYSSGR